MNLAQRAEVFNRMVIDDARDGYAGAYACKRIETSDGAFGV